MNDPGGQQDHLNGHSGFILAVFCVVSIFVIWPARIPLPNHVQRLLLLLLRRGRIISDDDCRRLSARRLYFSLSLKTAPVIGVILLLATTTIHGSTIKLGIKGDESIKPYDVLVLFISLVCWNKNSRRAKQEVTVNRHISRLRSTEPVLSRPSLCGSQREAGVPAGYCSPIYTPSFS